MSVKPKITIITPTYNRAHTLPRVYESLKNQTYKGFKWLIIDDGSTDNTADLIKKFCADNLVDIEYIQQKNQHKFLTVLDGIRRVETPYHMVVDSDDAYPKDALEILLNEVEKIEYPEKYIGVMALSSDENGAIVGDKYPNTGFDGSIFDMRYKYGVRGDKFGIFITKTYLKQIENKDYSLYKGKGYIPQSIIFNEYDAKGLKTRFINKVVRVYYKDENDAASVSNTRWTGRNVFGLKEGHLSLLNSYQTKLFHYPKTLIRNIIGYQFYSFKNNDSVIKSLSRIKNPIIRLMGWVLLPFSFLYHKVK